MLSDNFCKQLVMDAVEMLFEEHLPEYDHIEIEDKWKNVKQPKNYPNSGMITLYKNGKAVAKFHFNVKFCVYNARSTTDRYIDAEPTELVLELANGTKYEQIKKYICNNCNQEIEKDYRFCPLCGMERDNYQKQDYLEDAT